MKLDKKLEVIIKDARSKRRSSDVSPKDGALKMGSGSNYNASEARSNKSGPNRSGGALKTSPKGIAAADDTSYVLYEDPAEKLNLSDEKWNEIVQENLRAFKAEKEKAKADKFEKNRRV